MLIDHMALLFFPSLEWMRWCGRLAMPLFAFFIAEGARYTTNRKRYFGRTFLLGAACQAVYFTANILSGAPLDIHLNILFTFSCSMLVCFTYLDLEKALETRDKIRIFEKSAAFVSVVLALLVFDIFCTYLRVVTGVYVYLDYGVFGALLPLFALLCKSGKMRLISYLLGLIFFALSLSFAMPYIWFSLLSVLILFFYNGKRGSGKFKNDFYIFYPLHLALLYLIDMFI